MEMGFSMFCLGVEACKILKNKPCSLLILSRTLCALKGHIPRRSFLYIPGNDERKVSKATGLNSDCVVLDCEDGVATSRKVKTSIEIYACMQRKA